MATAKKEVHTIALYLSQAEAETLLTVNNVAELPDYARKYIDSINEALLGHIDSIRKALLEVV
jgi:hypothetical protein